MSKKWSKKAVINRLKDNPFFTDFFDEYKGGFSCLYDIDGVAVVIYNEIGGRNVSVYFIGFLSAEPDIIGAQSFASICYQYLNRQERE